jgi:D-beta-D-heptose 7-phosphate kinase / D-beta-D-heptose 1-phosphate adenosyltransferase
VSRTFDLGLSGQAHDVSRRSWDYGLGTFDERVRRWLVEHRDHFDLVELDAHDQDRQAGRVVDVATLAEAVDRHRNRGDRVVFTNGCFDVLHRGHVGYLAEARQLGDLLIVAVNSDESVRRLKGPERPVIPAEDRVAVLAALSTVDYVVVFEEDSPAALIEAICPDVYVKGGDYHPDMVPEAPLVRRLGGEVHTLGYLPDRSTSAIIERIRSSAARHRDRLDA